MAEFNILTESFVLNTSGTGNLYPLSPVEMQALIQDNSSLTISGSTVALFIDLGAQKDVDRIDYSFTPVSTSGISISYGRDADDLVTGSLTVLGQSVRVTPTTSGYSYPRYIKVEHQVPSGTPTVLNSLEVINGDTEVNFGQDGLLNSFAITGEASAEDTVYELYVRNDGSIPTDMFVSLDTNSQPIEVLEKFWLAPTVTGTFVNFDQTIEVPTTIPWEWGMFENITISSENKLSISNPNNPASTLSVGNEIGLTNMSGPSGGHQVEGVNSLGESVIISPRTDHAFNLLNVFKNVRTITSTPSHYTISNSDEQAWIYPAWDGDDTIYYLNGKATAEIQAYEISSDTHYTAFSGLSFYNRLSKFLFYHEGDLLVMGAQAAAGSSSDVGTQCWKVNVTTGAETPLQSMPASALDNIHAFTQAPNHIYFVRGVNNRSFYRYVISTDQWEVLQDQPTNNFQGGIAYSPLDNAVWTHRGDEIYEYDISSGQWNSTPIFDEMFDSPERIGVYFGGSTYYESEIGSASTHRARIIHSPIQLFDLNTPISGTWTSPVFRVETEENFRRILLDLENLTKVQPANNNLAAYTFEIRGSDSPPASDNFLENFGTALDEEVWATGIFNDVIATSNDYILTFSHDGETDIQSSGYVVMGVPLGTSGKMQYKIWWNPPTNKLSGSTNFSAIYIAPFLDVIFDGRVATRDPDSNQRVDDNYVYLKLGADGDSGGSISAIEFYNGSSVSTFSVSAGSGSFYEVNLVIDWTTGDYTVEFSGEEVGSGNIPAFKRAELEPQHTVEIFSGAETVDADEKFKYFSISRVGLEPASSEDRAFPVHIEDPLFGKDGSLEFTPVTVDSPLIPKTEFLQFRVSLETLLSSPEETPGLSAIKFPPVIKLENVQPGESKPVYFRYDFDSSNQNSSLELKLKAWMYTDKN